MKKPLLRSCFILTLILGFYSTKAQTINILNTNDSPSNPRSICQCDTLGTSVDEFGNVKSPPVQYFIGTAAFMPGTKFYFELASPGNNWSMADTLDLAKLTPGAPNQANPPDTFNIGTLYAHLAIPCNAPLGPATLRIEASNGVISDTIYYIINQVPSKPVIDSIAFGYPNPYTTTLNDWGFCIGDSVILYAKTQPGATYQWLKNGGIIPGEFDSSLVVKTSGDYTLRMSLGACFRDSKDTLINNFLPPTAVILKNIPGSSFASIAYQIDKPIPPKNITLNPIDSAQFCEDSYAQLQANAPDSATGLTYTYQWITDSVTQFGNTVYYPAGGNDTSQQYNVDTTGRYYVVIYDGYCSDTSHPYYVYMDTMPVMHINSQIYDGGILGGKANVPDICMRDSILLSASVSNNALRYRWQRLNTSLTPKQWEDLPNAVNPGLVGSNPTLEVDTSIKPVQSLSFYRLKISTLTPQGDEVCTYYTDSVRVRWFPEYDLTYQPQSWVHNVANVGMDSLSFCETDSAVLIAPSTPSQLINNGLFYSYQWLTDSLDTNGVIHKVPVPNGTLKNVTVFNDGKYYVAIDDGICIDTSAFVRVFVDTLPKTNILNIPYSGQTAPDGYDLCLTDSTYITAKDTVLPGWHYQWQRLTDTATGFVNLVNDTLPWLSVDTSYKPNSVDTLYFRLQIQYTNKFGLVTCPDVSDTVEIHFYNPPTLSFIPGNNVEICAGDSTLVVAQGNYNSISWQNGQVGSTIYVKQAGTYTATVVGINGCTTTKSINATYIVTTANAGSDVTALSGETVNLSGSGGVDYYWSSDKPLSWSGILSPDVSVSYTLPDGVESDTVTIYLQVTNSKGCTDVDSLLLIVNAINTDIVNQAWNLFTPNNDGRNDIWDISSITEKYNGCRIDILNRWGSVIYTNENFNGTWDGNNQGGNPMPDGTYYYILSCDGNIILKNAVTLIRNK